MGTGMAARKPAYGTSGIASYSGGGGGPPPSHPTMVGPVSSSEMPPMSVQQPKVGTAQACGPLVSNSVTSVCETSSVVFNVL